MFYLRIIFNYDYSNIQNTVLGSEYRIVNPKTFKCQEDWIESKRKDYPSAKLFIFYNKDGLTEVIPVYSEHSYYILTGDGTTYEKIRVPVDKRSINKGILA